LHDYLEIDAIEHHLKNTETLILIPHRDLHRYPIHTLFDRPTTHSPSIQSIQPIGKDGHGEPCPYNLSLLTIADPETDQPAMPYARLESAIIQSLVGAWLAALVST
jgi:hypothetical protein